MTALLPARVMPGIIWGMFLTSGEEQSAHPLAVFPSALSGSSHSKTTRTTCRGCPAQSPPELSAAAAFCFSPLTPPCQDREGHPGCSPKSTPTAKMSRSPGETAYHFCPKDNLCQPSLFSLQEGTGGFALQGDDRSMALKEIKKQIKKYH